ncbi:TBCC domain-containing protein 1-like [Tubulanus polymorphus]|uniref:TBCC domain-containing protein 1-like n=1 Tax=Tubulanus polymorphus TaxID=672921 RepID=UPI003DA2F530
MDAVAVSIWVRNEPFINGVLPILPHPRLSVHNIKKLVGYARGKGKYGFPRLSYTVWRHIACNKLQLSEELAWMFFVTCDMVAENSSEAAENRLFWNNKFSSCSTQAEKDQLKNQAFIGLFHFVLILYIQQLNKISLRSSLISGDENPFIYGWPSASRPRSPASDVGSHDGRLTPTSARNHDEQSHANFVLHNLPEMLELLVEPDSYALGGIMDQNLSIDAIQALGLIFDASIDKGRTIRSLCDVALLQQVQQKSGFSKISQSFNMRTFITWIKTNVIQNPFGIASCISQGKRLSWPLGVDEKESTHRKGRVATNAHLVMRDDSNEGNKLIIMSQVSKQTIARTSSTLEGATVKIHRCHQSFIYLLSSMRTVSIEKCRNTTVVLGAVECAVHVSHCEQVTVIAACRRITTSHSQICTFHLLTPNRPLVFGGNDTIILAPYNTSYPQLETQMNSVGLSYTPNYWDVPFCVGPDHHENSPPVWEIMPANDFHSFAIPFVMEGELKSPPPVPNKYQKAIKQREKKLEQWQKSIKETNLSKEHRKQFQSLVETRFQIWLAESGNKRELDSLATALASKK